MGGRVFYSRQEFEREYFPNSILDKLDESLCGILGLTGDWQHRLVKDGEDPKKGSLELAKPMLPGWIMPDLSARIGAFYVGWGYKVDAEEGNNKIKAGKGEEKYEIQVLDLGTSYFIDVRSPVFS